MNKVFKKIARKVRPLARRRASLLVMGLILAGVLIPQTAFAVDTETKELEQILNELLQYINVGFRLIHALFWPILLMIGSLMDNDLIFGPGIGERLREIWVIMRNLVNIIFVFLLLIVAFYNVSGMGGDGNLALKTVLPKLVMALIAVNFSFLGCKVILDAANVVNMAVYDLAGAVDYDEAQIENDMVRSLCTNPSYLSEGCYVEEGGSAVEQGSSGVACSDISQSWKYENANVVAKMVCCNETSTEDACQDAIADAGGVSEDANGDEEDDGTPKEIFPALNDFGKNFFMKLDQNNIGVVMAVNLGQLNKLTEVVEGGGVTLTDLTINVLFSIFMYLVFGFAYAALFIVLLARLVVLWMVIALSPLMILIMAIPQLKEYTSELDLANRFVQHLLAPIIIGLSMSIGYLMIDKMNNIQAGGVESGFMQVNLGDELSSGDVSGQLLAPNINDIQQLMIAVLAVAIVWLGVFGAAEKTIASSITGKIKEFGEKAAKFTASLPKYVPFVPIQTQAGEDPERLGFADMTNVLRQIESLPERKSQAKVSELLAPVLPGGITAAYNTESEALRRAMASENPAQITTNLSRTLTKGELDTPENYRDFEKMIEEQAREKGQNINLPGNYGKFRTWYKQAENREALATAVGATGGGGALPTQLPEGSAPATETSAPPSNFYANLDQSSGDQIIQQISGNTSNLSEPEVQRLQTSINTLAGNGGQSQIQDILNENSNKTNGQLTKSVVEDMEAAAEGGAGGAGGANPPTA